MFQFSILKSFSDQIHHGLVLDSAEKADAVMADQVHGDRILEVDKRPEKQPQCDAFITRQKNLTLLIEVADCQGVLVYDPVTCSIGAAHSGWRGSALNIIGKTIAKMQEVYGSSPADLRIGISPSLGPCCAEFSDPFKELPAFCHPFVDSHNHVDFWALSVRQCKEAGVPESRIEVAGQCTKCQPGFVSYRNGDSGRMGIFATLT